MRLPERVTMCEVGTRDGFQIGRASCRERV